MTSEREKARLEREAAGRRARRLLDKALGDLEAAVTAAEKAGLKRQARKLDKLDREGVVLLQSWPDDKSGRTT
jgi:translation elongation factor EF-Ts